MRVLSVGSMYPPHHLGGYELTWRSVVEALRGGGHEVIVLTSDFRGGPGGPDDPEVHRQLRWYWRDHEFPRLRLRERRALEAHNLRVLRGRLDEFAPDVVNWWAMGGMSMSMVELVGRSRCPAVGVLGDDWLTYGPRADAWQRALGAPAPVAWVAERLTGIPTRLHLGRAASWIFISEVLRRKASEAGIPVGDATVAHVGPDRALFRPAPASPWRGELLYAGRIDRRKGIATAIKATALLPETRLRVDGSGDEPHLYELRSLARSLELESRVSFVNSPRADLPRAYADADAVLFPVLWDEPWGLVPLEAMAVGTPVIASGRGGSSEYLRDGQNCLIADPADSPETLAANVTRIAGDEELRARLREGGLATAGEYDPARFADAVAAALEAAAS